MVSQQTIKKLLTYGRGRFVVKNKTGSPTEDLEGQNPNLVAFRTRARRVSCAATVCLLLTFLTVIGIGIFGGKCLYNQYINAQMHHIKGTVQIPLHSKVQHIERFSLPDSAYLTAHAGYDNDDEFEIDMDKQKYGKIEVCDGKLIHDFNSNVTGIIDIMGNRCFVMLLNRGNILQPKSLSALRETMRVITPPLEDLKGIGTYIAKMCENKPVYKLEKYVGGVVERFADPHVEAKFTQSSGSKITEIDIVNFGDLQSYEKKNKLH